MSSGGRGEAIPLGEKKQNTYCFHLVTERGAGDSSPMALEVTSQHLSSIYGSVSQLMGHGSKVGHQAVWMGTRLCGKSHVEKCNI